MTQMLRLPAVREAIGVGRTTLTEWWAEFDPKKNPKGGLFPRPVKITSTTNGWPADEVEAVVRAKVAGKSDEEIRELVRSLVAARSNGARPSAPRRKSATHKRKRSRSARRSGS